MAKPEGDSSAATGSPAASAPARPLRLPWLGEPLAQALRARAHALLIHGARGVGQFELALTVAEATLCESTTRPPGQPACGVCAACLLMQARTHPDLLVLVPEAEREVLGWSVPAAEGEEGGGDAGSRRKPSKEIRIEAIRDAIAFASTTSARGRAKAVVLHPAERMNDVAANAFLKTLEEPPGSTRFLLSCASPDALPATIRSRCQSVAIALPPAEVAEAWLTGQGVADPAVLLAACGGQPLEAFAWSTQGIDAATWRALPARVGAGDAAVLRGWPLPLAIGALQKLCHDALAESCAAAPRYFPHDVVPSGALIGDLLAWSRELGRVARDAEHPWNVELTVESLVEQGREALNTARSPRRAAGADSLHSGR